MVLLPLPEHRAPREAQPFILMLGGFAGAVLMFLRGSLLLGGFFVMTGLFGIAMAFKNRKNDTNK